MTQNLEEGLQDDYEPLPKADSFYRQTLQAETINRYHQPDSELDQEFKRMGIDASIVAGDKTYYLSERFHSQDDGEFYVELFHQYPTHKGSIFTDSADYIVEFTPHAVYMVQCKSLKEFIVNRLFPDIPEEYYEDLYDSRKNRKGKEIEMDDEMLIEFDLIQAYGQDNNPLCETIGLCMPYEVLEKNGVKIKKYPR